MAAQSNADTIVEAADQFIGDRLPLDSPEARLTRMAYMAGALEALTCERPREHVLAELVQYGKTIGSAVERATP